MAPRRMDIPLYYRPMMGDDYKEWINKAMAKSRRLRGRPTGILTMPFTMRQVLDRTIAIMGDDAEAPPNPCLTTQKDNWFPDPVKIAKCIISKPTIREMGEDEEKIYCGMIYGPEYSDYEYKAKKRIAKTIRKLFRKHLPMMNDLLEKRKKENKENIRKDFKAWLQKGKESILKEKEEELKVKEINAMNKIKLERQKALEALKGKMEIEIKEVTDSKKEYLKGVYQFQLDWILKDNEKNYTERMNLYSTIWNKILQNLSERAKRKISELNCSANQTIDKETVQAIVEKEDYNNDLTVMMFKDKVLQIVKELKSKVLAEELHIQQEKRRGDSIKSIVEAWNSLLEHVIMLFDKVVVYGFKETPGVCNYFLDRGIIEKLNKSLKEADEMGSITSKSLEKLNETQRSEESSPVLSREISEFTLDMTVDPPDKDLIAKLNLFQVKKLIEETTCEVLTKPLQIAAFMKDKSVELKSFSEKSSQESSYILNRLSDAYSLLEKILFKTESKELATAVVEEVPYSIETDQETKERVNSIIKAYRNHPYLIRALTKV